VEKPTQKAKGLGPFTGQIIKQKKALSFIQYTAKKYNIYKEICNMIGVGRIMASKTPCPDPWTL
jgi:hypothetical protein